VVFPPLRRVAGSLARAKLIDRAAGVVDSRTGPRTRALVGLVPDAVLIRVARLASVLRIGRTRIFGVGQAVAVGVDLECRKRCFRRLCKILRGVDRTRAEVVTLTRWQAAQQDHVCEAERRAALFRTAGRTGPRRRRRRFRPETFGNDRRRGLIGCVSQSDTPVGGQASRIRCSMTPSARIIEDESEARIGLGRREVPRISIG